MRTQKFQRVFDRIVRQLGRDPLAQPPQDMSRTILEHINDRVEEIHQAWDWPEWTITEERAFRQVWLPTTQYKRVSDLNGLPDEVFYLGDSFVAGGDFGTGYGYYKVDSTEVTDPPIGTLPTNATYWVPIDQPVDAYIDYDQICQRAIGRVIGVYTGNPRLNGCGNRGLWFKPSQYGIDVRGSSGLTVFISYLMPPPVYSIIPYAAGRTYERGDVVFDPATGECYQAVITTVSNPGPTGDWRWVPFLNKWATYVVQGAFADCLSELDQGGNDDVQARLTLAARAEGKATAALEARIDDLAAQGHVLKYSFCKKCDCWCESLPFTGGSVTTLTEECFSNAGWIYPSPTPASQGFYYYPTVMSLKTSTPTLIATVPTVGFATGTIAKIYTGAEFRLDAGTSNPAGDPGQGNPADYDLAENNKHWVQVI